MSKKNTTPQYTSTTPGQAFLSFIKSGIVQLSIQILTVCGLLLASYITIRLVPIATRQDQLESRVQAMDSVQQKEYDSLEKRLERLEQGTYRIETKLDTLILR